jgi:hypothetical protein
MSNGYDDIVNFLDLRPEFARPSNGFIYNETELDALWEIGPTGAEVLNGPLGERWEFARHCVALNLPENNEPVTSQQMVDILTKAILAEVEDPQPLDLKPPLLPDEDMG